jgi:hypothetical protein
MPRNHVINGANDKLLLGLVINARCYRLDFCGGAESKPETDSDTPFSNGANKSRPLLPLAWNFGAFGKDVNVNQRDHVTGAKHKGRRLDWRDNFICDCLSAESDNLFCGETIGESVQ